MEKYHFLPIAVLRTPALSFLDYNIAHPALVLQNNNFQKAILIASQVLYEQLEKVDFDWERLNKKERHTVQKYINRACFRSTPFGAFAMVTPVRWGNKESIHITGQQLHVAPNFKAGILASRSIRESEGKVHRLFTANKSIYRCGNELRYLAATSNTDDSGLDFTIRSVGNSSWLRRLVIFCEQARPYPELLNFLQHYVSSEEAVALIDELLTLQLLTDDLLPNITGQDYLERIAPEQTKQLLAQSVLATSYCNTTGIAVGELDLRHQETLLDSLDSLVALQGKAPIHPNLAGFVKDFTEKFGGQTLPLLYVLDPETGVGYQDLAANEEGRELIAGIEWPVTARNTATIPWSKTHSLLLNKWSGRQPIRLTAEDLAKLNDSDVARLPPSISMLFRVIGDQVLVESAGGPTVCGLIGRFTPFDDAINELARSATEAEARANPGVIFAEIAHVCDFRTANINRRSTLYSYEIPVLVTSLQPEGFQIPLNDLWVSVMNGEIVLYSEKHNKQVIPRLSSAFNYIRNDLSIFRFLCDLQHQGLTSGLSLDLRAYFPDLDFYPRVEYRKAILHLASWNIPVKIFRGLQTLPVETQWLAFKKIVEELQLPEWVALTVNDNQLIFHLTNREDIPLFLEAIDKQETILLKEFIDQTGQTPVVNRDQRQLINQFIAGLYTEKEVYSGKYLAARPKDTLPRKLAPGSEWLYFKIYGHASRANELLAKQLSLLVRQLFREGMINNWFFIRYTDPKDHIRLRLHVCPGKVEGAIALTGKQLGRLLQAGKIADFSIAVYERELERYGHAELPALENLFFESSELVMAYIRSGYPDYVAFGIDTVRMLLDAFQVRGSVRVAFLERQSQAFMNEFAADAALRLQLDRNFRKFRTAISLPLSPEVAKAADKFRQGAAQFYLDHRKNPSGRLQQWLSDLIHMHLNRLFTGDSRKQECVLYYVLWKHEKGLLARSKSG